MNCLLSADCNWSDHVGIAFFIPAAKLSDVEADLLSWRFPRSIHILNMFDSFFKRSANPPLSSAIPVREIAEPAPPDRDKNAALQQARSLGGEESAAVEFILQCQFADARFIAAGNIYSKAMLERVLPSMRNADRRVAKLMQTRLDALALNRQSEHQAQQCVDQALRLANEPVLLPNQLVDLDRSWQLIGSRPESIQSAFDDARSVLHERLEAQTKLQRAVIDNLARLRALSTEAAALAAPEIAVALDNIEQEMAQHLSSGEASSLPKNLLSEFSAEHQQLSVTFRSAMERHEAVTARAAMLQRWEAPDERIGLTADALKRAWLALPALPSDAEAEALHVRFDTLLQDIAAHQVQIKRVAAAKPDNTGADNTNNVAEILESLEKALQEGAVRAAVEIDKQLRSSDMQGIRLSSEQTSHLAKVRSELSRLQGWAKWGGNISREELLKAAEELPSKKMAAPELAKKVGGLRERWKSLDTSAGSAGKDLWERFDAACTLAYAPAAAHFKKLADERQGNLQKAEALISETRQFAVTSNCAENNTGADWKAIASFCTSMLQAWQRLGIIDRKDKKRLDAEFNQAMQLLQAPLAIQQQAATARREDLIKETLALNPTDRITLDAVRTLQERWQQLAKTLPLERKVEQALWLRFRAACDTLFLQRKEAAANADAERKLHLAEKESLCAKLESSTVEHAPTIPKILRDAKDAWSKIGPAPRAMENHIEARFHAAVSVLQKQLDAAKRGAANAELASLVSKVRLCQSIEQSLAHAQKGVPAALEQWEKLSALPAEIERIVRTRFDMAFNALQAGDGQYLAMLEKNRDLLSRSLLRFEILAGIESPAELSRERLQMQVEVLQSTLKAGPVTNKQKALLDLFRLAALTDEKTMGRIEQAIRKVAELH
jgi:hypothetical protein